LKTFARSASFEHSNSMMASISPFRNPVPGKPYVLASTALRLRVTGNAIIAIVRAMLQMIVQRVLHALLLLALILNNRS
jgi:hypothetical protein